MEPMARTAIECHPCLRSKLFTYVSGPDSFKMEPAEGFEPPTL